MCINLKHPGHEWALLVSLQQTTQLLLAVLEFDSLQVVELMLVKVFGEKEGAQLVVEIDTLLICVIYHKMFSKTGGRLVRIICWILWLQIIYGKVIIRIMIHYYGACRW